MIDKQIVIALQVTALIPYLGIIIYTLLKWSRSKPICHDVMLALCFAALVLHAIAIYALIQNPYGWNIQFEYSISLIVNIATLVICITQLRTKIHTIIVCHAPIAILAIAYSMSAINQPVEFVAYKLGWHIVLSVGAFSTFGIATLHSVLIWFYQQHLKQHQEMRFSWMKQLPPLESMNHLLINFIVVCVVLLSLSIITGGFFTTNIVEQQLTHKTFFTLLAWIVCVVIIFKHYRSGWNSLRLIHWVWAGFGFLMLAYLGSKFVLERLL